MNIVVYTVEGCLFCDKIKSFLSDNNLSYFEKDVSINEDYRNELIERNVQGIPFTVINNSREFMGFNEDVKSALEELKNNNRKV